MQHGPPLRLPQLLAHRQKAVVAQGFALEDATLYTDGITDLPLLMRVGRPVAVNPDLRLRRVARSRGWPIERW